jgi:hypothetical protein
MGSWRPASALNSRANQGRIEPGISQPGGRSGQVVKGVAGLASQPQEMPKKGTCFETGMYCEECMVGKVTPGVKKFAGPGRFIEQEARERSVM